MADTIYTAHPADISGPLREFKLYDEQTTTAGGTVYFNEFPTTAGFAYVVEGWIIAYKADFSEKAIYQLYASAGAADTIDMTITGREILVQDGE